MIRRTENQLHPIVYIVILGSVMMNIGFGMVVPFFAIYMSTFTGLNTVAIGFIIGATSIGSMLGGYIGGTLSDLYGRKKLMLMSLIISAIVYLGFIFNSFPILLILLTLIKGLSISFFDPAAKALIADFTERKYRLKAFSMRYIGVNMGFAIGPLLGLLIGIHSSSRLPFILAAIILLSYAVVLYLKFLKYNIQDISFDEEPITLKSSFHVIRKDILLLLFLFGGLLATSVHGQFSVVLSQYFERELQSGLEYLMLLWTVHSMVIVIFGLPIVKIMEKHSSLRSIISGSLLFSLGLIGFSLSYNFWAFCVSMIVFTLGEIFLLPAEYSIIDEITPDHLRGSYYGAVNFTSIGSFFGPGIAGFILLSFGGAAMFNILACIMLFSLVFYVLGNKLKEHNSKKSFSISVGE